MKQDRISLEKLVDLTAATEESLANLPSDSLEQMLSSLQVSIKRVAVEYYSLRCYQQNLFAFHLQLIVLNLTQQEKDINILQASTAGSSCAPDTIEIITQLKQKIAELLSRSNSGITLITVSIRYCSTKNLLSNIIVFNLSM